MSDVTIAITEEPINVAVAVTESAVAISVAVVEGLSDAPADTNIYGRQDNTWVEVTGGASAWGGITGTLSAQTDLQTALDGKVDENIAIIGGTKTKITYDAKGLVTAGADATTADIADSSNKRYVTDAQITVIGNTSGTNTGDQDLSGYFNKSADDLDDITEGAINKAFTATLKTKLDAIAEGATNVNQAYVLTRSFLRC